ncbi:hypothetical protein [Polyangium aurulentum]|uniref:hypothetical protein n=1 Tax=Polyangium aurulentum TaxID=2567896 RepID=UPI0010AE1910|nr:hypothetical protein [Polyangium aurulentum]UQA62594.1 hypothetical protein E8A73_019925 [Polyangium aurulentum]
MKTKMGGAAVALIFGALAIGGCAPVVSFDGGDSESQAGVNAGDQGKPGVVAPPSCGDELHLIGIYESHGNHGYDNHPAGAASVHVERKGSSILALSSYEPVHWTVTAAEGVVLEKVILNGYHDQTADVPAGVEVEVHDGPDGSLGAYAYAWPSSEGGSDTQGLVSTLEGITGRALTSFNGCYQASSFTLHDDLTVDAACATEAGYEVTSYVADISGGDCDDDPADPCAGKAGTGSYVGSFCEVGYPFILTEDIACGDALDNCLLNESLNPGYSMHCTWNGEVIHLQEQTAGACNAF